MVMRWRAEERGDRRVQQTLCALAGRTLELMRKRGGRLLGLADGRYLVTGSRQTVGAEVVNLLLGAGVIYADWIEMRSHAGPGEPGVQVRSFALMERGRFECYAAAVERGGRA